VSLPWARRLLVGVGVGCVVLAGLVLVPVDGRLGAARGAVVDVVAAVPSALLAWTVTFGAGCYAVVRLYRARSRPSRPPPFAFESGSGSDADPRRTRTAVEAGSDATGDRRTVGTAFRATVERTAVGTTDPADDDRVRGRLRATAVETVHRAAREPADRADAERAVRRGEWTDDPVAAAFLADEDGPDQPPSARLRGWFSPARAFKRRVDRTVVAIHRQSAASDRPDRDGADRPGDTSAAPTAPGGGERA